MRKINKILIPLLALTMGLTSFAGCKGGKNEAKGTVNDVADHKVTQGTLHEVKVDYSAPVADFVKGGKSDYKIVVADKYAKAGAFLAKHVAAATGAQLAVDYSGSCVPSSGKYIILGDNHDMETYSFTMPSRAELGSAGYYIETVKDDAFISFYTAHGAQMGVLAFMREVIGYDMLSEDLVIYERDGEKLPSMKIKERPDYEFRVVNNKLGEEATYGMGFTTASTMLSTSPNGSVHNMYDFFTEEDFKKHPEWFSAGALKTVEGDPGYIGQPCFTAGGNAESYALMTKTVANKIFELIKDRPNDNNVRISPNDVTGGNMVARCTCKACEASFKHYGTVSGSMLAFTNDVAKILNARVAEQLPDRKINLIALVYGKGINAPVQLDNGKYVFDENGKGVPTTRYDFDEEGNGTPAKDENGKEIKLVCEEGVGWEYAPSGANWIHSFYDKENASYAQTVNAWSGLGGDLYVWAYEINYHAYFYPYNNYDVIIENFRYYKEHGGNYIYPEGTFENLNAPAFAKFRDYLDAKAMFDVNSDYAALKDKYFKHYFGPAERNMRTFLELVQKNLYAKEGVTGGLVQDEALLKEEVWPFGFVLQLNGLIEDSYAIIENYKTKLDESRYEAYKKHLLIESLFPRLVFCTTYANEFNAETLTAMRRSFKDDFVALGNVTHKEHFTAAEILFPEWNLD